MITIKNIISKKNCEIHEQCPKMDGYCSYKIRIFYRDKKWHDKEWKLIKPLLLDLLVDDIICIIFSYLCDLIYSSSDMY